MNKNKTDTKIQMIINERFKKKQIIIVFLVTLLIFLMPYLIYALAGAYGTSSPISCSDNCSGSYELLNHSWTYCNENPIECFNTIDDCKDGFSLINGIPHPSDYEWIENVTLTNLNRTENFTGGDIVEIHAVFQCDYQSDQIAFVYNNGSGWQKKYYSMCQGYDMVDAYYNVTLDGLNGVHTIRTIISYGDSLDVECGFLADSQYSDTDDVSFFVNSNFETNPPVILPIEPIMGKTYEYIIPKTINLEVKVTDDIGVDKVYANITWDNNLEVLNLEKYNLTNWKIDFKKMNVTGIYNVTFFANDTNSNINFESTYFYVNDTFNISVKNPINEKWYPDYIVLLDYTISSLEKINWTGYKLNDDAYKTVINSFEHKNDYNQTITYLGNPSNVSQLINLTENISIGEIQIYIKSKLNKTNNLTLQIRNDSSQSPGGILKEINISIIVSNETSEWISFQIENPLIMDNTKNYWLHLPNVSEFLIPVNNESYDSKMIVNTTINNTHDILFKVIDEYHHIINVTFSTELNTIKIYANSTTQNNLLSPTIRFNIDVFGPEFKNLNYFPNTQKDIDPNKTINVTVDITDEFNVSTAILQYKKDNDSIWQNLTMQKNLDNYYMNFTPLFEGNYTIQVWANDTLSNYNLSINETIEVLYEKDFIINTTLFNTTKGTSILVNTSLGVIKIKNTGDLNKTFIINKSSNTIPFVYFNNETEISLTIAPGLEENISVVATGLGGTTNSLIEIQIMSDNDSVQLINSTLATFSQNEYLLVEITQYDPTVTQGDKRITLAASIENLGSEIARNVTLAWSIPVGWTAKNNLTKNLGNISAYSPIVSYITIDVSDTAPTGTKTISLYVQSNETNNTDQKTVTVSAKQEPQIIIETSSGSPTPGGVSSMGGFIEVGKPEIIIGISDSWELIRGEKKNFTINISNTESKNISNITLSIDTGILVKTTLIQNNIFDLPSKSTKNFTFSINAPIYANPGKYPVKIKAEFLWGSEIIYSEKENYLIILDEDIINFTKCITDSETSIKEIENRGFNIQQLNNLLKESTRSLIEKDYENSINICEEILGLIIKAKESNNQLIELENKINNDKVKNAKIIDSLNLAKEAFERGDYELAITRLEDTKTILEIEKNTASYQMKRFFNIIISNWQILLILSVIIGIGSYSINRKYNVMYSLNKIKNLEEEEELIKELISKVQRHRYQKHTISKSIYNNHMNQYRISLANIQKQKNSILLKINNLKGLTKEENIISQTELVKSFKKKLQKNFYLYKSVDKKSYDSLEAEYNIILSDLKEKLAEAVEDE